ncbi:hypothetical protein [Vibrio sp. 1636]|nr:hypothetical protein [Vibrio sp. 1636]
MSMNTQEQFETSCEVNTMMVGFNPETGGVVLMAPYYYDHYRAVRDVVLQAIPMHVSKVYEYDENDKDAVPPQVVVGVATKIAETLLMDSKLFQLAMSAANELEYVYKGEEEFDPEMHLPLVLTNLSQQACDYLTNELKDNIKSADDRLGGTSEETKQMLSLVIDMLDMLKVETKPDSTVEVKNVQRVVANGETIH